MITGATGKGFNHGFWLKGKPTDTLVPEIYVIMAIHLKCVAVLFRSSPEGNTTLSTIKAYNGYQPCHRVFWINPAANITFSLSHLRPQVVVVVVVVEILFSIYFIIFLCAILLLINSLPDPGYENHIIVSR